MWASDDTSTRSELAIRTIPWNSAESNGTLERSRRTAAEGVSRGVTFQTTGDLRAKRREEEHEYNHPAPSGPQGEETAQTAL